MDEVIFKWMRDPKNGIPDSSKLEEIEPFRNRIADLFDLKETNKNIDKAFQKYISIDRPFNRIAPDTTVDKDEVQIDWIKGTSRPYWSRLRNFLQNERGRSPESVTLLDDSSDAVLRRLAAPGSARRKQGMVIGYVQSGKTANMAAVMAKAADEGYKLFIVLAGTLNNLRSQTQLRFIQELVGTENGYLIAGSEGSIPTVKQDLNGFAPEWKKLTDFDYTTDANGDIGDIANTDLTLKENKSPLLAVIKKKSGRMKKLTSFLEKHGLDFENTSVFIIDDESDAASINTAEARNEVTSTNRAIRNLIQKFKTVTYVGYTATPYANLFINFDQAVGSESLGADLFPEDFVSLLDKPPGYFGASDIFGLTGDSEEDEGIVNRVGGLPIFPKFHKTDDGDWNFIKTAKSIDEVPSLRDAVDSFLLSCAAREARGDGNSDMTMLINPGPTVDSHFKLESLVKEYIRTLIRDIRANDLDTVSRLLSYWRSEFMDNPERSIQNIRTNLEEANQNLKQGFQHSFQKLKIPEEKEILSGLKEFSKSGFDVLVINKDSRNAKLQYNVREAPKRYIVIGGNKLSRGLTLEGLSVSYFLRNPGSPCYDTLMQMGRWFGYRTDFIDLCRIWAHPEVVIYFSQIALADQELRETLVTTYKHIKPRDIPPKVFRFDGLNITANNKMGAAVRLSKSGARLEQTRVPGLSDVIRRNNDAWLEFLGVSGQASSPKDGFVNFSSSFTAGSLLEGIKKFKIDTMNLNLDFLNEQAKANSSASNWKIALVGSIKNPTPKDFKVGTSQFQMRSVRRRVKEFGNGEPGFKVVSEGNRIDEFIDDRTDEGYLFLHIVSPLEKDRKHVPFHDLQTNKIVRDTFNAINEAGFILVPVLKMPVVNGFVNGGYYGQVVKSAGEEIFDDE